jgi:phage protein D
MNIIYEGVDITNSIEIRKADIIDNAGGCADSIDLSFADTEGLWSKWKPLKGHKINVLEGGFSSGVMFTDYINQSRGSIRLKGLSLPPGAKTGKTKAWEAIRFMQMAMEISNAYGFTLQTFGIPDHLYERIDQINETDFDFLLHRCIFEGYSLKICNSKVVIYSEINFETKAAVKTISLEQFDGDYEFKAASTGLYSKCVISCSTLAGTITKEFKPESAPSGPVLKPRVYVTSLAEAERYCKGLLRAANKSENTGKVQIELDPELAAGSCVEIDGVGLANGKYFIEQAIHKLKDKKTVLRLRKPLEGY